MKQNYIICKGKRYNSGDTMDILWYTNGYRNAHNYTGIFVDCDPEKDEYRFIVDGFMYCFNKVCFWRIVVSEPIQDGPLHKIRKPSKPTFKEELSIDGLFVAWIWYIFIMLVLVIFNGRILGWIVASIVFFDYRNNKLRKAGYKS